MRFKLNWLPTGAIQKYSREAKKELSAEKPKLGIIYMKMKLILAANAIALCGAALAWESPSRFGVCSHLNRWEFPVVDQQLPIMKKAGIKICEPTWTGRKSNPKKESGTSQNGTRCSMKFRLKIGDFADTSRSVPNALRLHTKPG
ncbi:MAG: hypothetical protein ACLUKN_13185 [Bacilli bacterium]